jgi:hypothetical protein
MLIETQVGLLSMAAEEYHRNKDAVGHSSLVRIMRSPAHFQEYVTHPPEPTPAMAFGTAVHSAVLEPAAFASDYAVFDESQLEGSLQSLDDYKAAAAELGIKVGKMKKEEIKDAIKATDVESRFVFREDAIARLYDGKQILTPTLMMAIRSIQASISRHAGARVCWRTGWLKCLASGVIRRPGSDVNADRTGLSWPMKPSPASWM